MGIDLNLIYLFSILIGTILLFWIVMNSMIRDKKIFLYIPFYLIGVLLFISTVFLFFNISSQKIWVFVEISIGVCLFFIFTEIMRVKND